MRVSFWYICAFLILCGVALPAQAQTVPSAADVSRVDENQAQKPLPLPTPDVVELPEIQPASQPPANAYEVKLTIKNVEVYGATAFSAFALEALYDQFLGEEVTLNTLWVIAQDITDLYHKKGYFLSRAYVPEQEVESGNVRIQVVEGFIGRVQIEDKYLKSPLIRAEVDKITEKTPVRRQDLEAMLLGLNDLPGVVFDAVLKPERSDWVTRDGQVLLEITGEDTGPRAQATLDNYGSEYLGPWQLGLGLQAEILPYQQTSINVATSQPEDELVTASVEHQIPLTFRTKMKLNASVTHTKPGENLAANNVLGDSVSLGFSFEHNIMRQRRQNLTARAAFEARNSKTDLLASPLVRDETRTVTLGLSGDRTTESGAVNQFDVSVNKGLGILGASDKGDSNLSRSQADPNHIKFEASYIRQQPMFKNVMLQFMAEGQWSPDSLVSSEEFGFGGPRLGRAFDASEISGDSGFATGLEVHYLGLGQGASVRPIPYAFFDIGRVWNEEPGRDAETASSAGLGLRLMHELDSKARVYADVYAAQPIINRQNTPQFGEGKAPRFGVRVGVLK